MNQAAKMSKMLFDARESIQMFYETVEHRTGQMDYYNRGLVDTIDDYRISHGWNPYGFGGESLWSMWFRRRVDDR